MEKIKFAVLVLGGMAIFGLISCEKSESQLRRSLREEDDFTAAVHLIDAQFSAQEALTVWFENIKDEDSARLAMANFDKVAKEYERLEEAEKRVERMEFDPDDLAKIKAYQDERMSSLDGRTESAKLSAIDALGSNRELLKELINKMGIISKNKN